MDFKLDEVEILLVGEMLLFVCCVCFVAIKKSRHGTIEKKIKILRTLRVGAEKILRKRYFVVFLF